MHAEVRISEVVTTYTFDLLLSSLRHKEVLVWVALNHFNDGNYERVAAMRKIILLVVGVMVAGSVLGQSMVNRYGDRTSPDSDEKDFDSAAPLGDVGYIPTHTVVEEPEPRTRPPRRRRMEHRRTRIDVLHPKETSAESKPPTTRPTLLEVPRVDDDPESTDELELDTEEERK